VFAIMSQGANYQPWSEEDIERLRQHIERGGSAPRAAIIFKRTERAVRAQAASLGLKFPTIRDLRKKAAGSGELVPD
jgi:hypothetical protein